MKYLAIFLFLFLLSSCKPYYRYLHIYVYEEGINKPLEGVEIAKHDHLENDSLIFAVKAITNIEGFAKLTIKYKKQPSYREPFKYIYLVRKTGYKEIYIKDFTTKFRHLSSDSEEHIYVIDSVFLERKKVEKE